MNPDTKDLISIIIPTYNRGHLLPATLDSIIEQNHHRWECVIIDDGSSDDTEEIVTSYIKDDSRFKFFKRPAHLPKGAPCCRNFGYQNSVGEYIQWFDSDDIMLPSMLSAKLAILHQHPNHDFIVAKMGEFSQLDQFYYPQYAISSDNIINDFLTYKIFFLTPGPLFRRKFLEKQKLLFDVNLIKHQEWEFFSRLLLGGGKFVVSDEYVCMRRMHGESIKAITGNLERKVRVKNKMESVIALNKNTGYKFSKTITRLFQRKALSGMWQACRRFDLKYLIYFSGVLLRLRLKQSN